MYGLVYNTIFIASISVCDRIDMVLLLDASADMFERNRNNPTVDGYNDNWSVLINNLAQGIPRNPISVNGNRMAIISYGYSVHVEIRFDDFLDTNQFVARLRTLRVSTWGHWQM